MPQRVSKTGSELFIVDNSDEDWKVVRYLQEWCQISASIDIATGYFEIGSLLALKDEWQKVDNIRILMGDEVSKRTYKAFLEGVQTRLDDSIEREKYKNDFLEGVPAIVDAIRTGKIQCRVYRKGKFHAKAYITHARLEVVGSSALIGSSNFTFPGLTENIELNVQITGRPVSVLQEWYDEHWNEAEDVTLDILRVMERQIHDYSPFEVYAKALDEYFRGHRLEASEWEKSQSQMYGVLDQYQKDGYGKLTEIAQRYGGAFLCDGVGLGKTFIGLMLIERLILHEKKRVLLLVPKAARHDVWERAIDKYLSHIGGTKGGMFSSLFILNHTDLGRGADYPHLLERAKQMADVILIDEAHHFRNPGIEGRGERRPSRYRLLAELLQSEACPKQLYMLTATPINNSLHDFRHMLELITHADEQFFKTSLGIHSLRGHFIKMDQELREAVQNTTSGNGTIGETNLIEAEHVLKSDDLFRALVVQRSRSFVKQSQIQQGSPLACFPTREIPRVADYSVKKTYGRLLEMVEKAFAKDKPLFVLGIYNPLAYFKDPDKSAEIEWEKGRQKQVVSLIRTQFLKRFESSAHAFQLSCARLLAKLLAWVKKHAKTEGEKRRLERFLTKYGELIGYEHKIQHEIWDSLDEMDEDFVSEEMLNAIEELDRRDFLVEDIINDSIDDLEQIAEFLTELRKFKPLNDDKLKALTKLLKSDPVLKKEKVLIFTEFAETARYLKKELDTAGITGVSQIDSGTKGDRSSILRRFAPYYNGSSSAELAAAGEEEIRILISTDVLSEGLNLQDATRLINYDLHWNPVRLMQRIGRVDRRMNPETEELLLADHPEQKDLRGKIVYWNFLPPEDLERLLALYTRVSHKTLVISKTFGIEGKKLLRPDDDFEALKEFNHEFEGKRSPTENMLLEYEKLVQDYPDLVTCLAALPGRVFSGKAHPTEGTRAVFFCYRIPRADTSAPDEQGNPAWTEESGETRWYLYNLADQRIVETPSEIISLIRSTPETPRHCVIEKKTLSDIRITIEKQIKNSVLKSLQAPVTVKPILKAWMELN